LLDFVLTILFMIMAYLLGSIPTGYLVARARGVDIQKVGSGNIGATNVLRSVGKIPALIVVIMDPLKGFLAVLIPMLVGMSSWTICLAGLAAVLGNDFNLFLRLRGGKGVATSTGVFLGIDPLVTLLASTLAIATMSLGRYVSLGSLVGMTAAPLLLLAKGGLSLPPLCLAFALMALAFLRHRDNIIKLAEGTERRLGQKTTPQEKP
jgi:acyl phosphate:glycerol-3-phosphate acyltransferase